MTEIIGVRFKESGKVYFFAPEGQTVELGEHVIVETARGPEFGEVALANQAVEEDQITQPLKPMLRKATPEDVARMAEKEAREREAMQICAASVETHKLDMHLVEAEYTFDGSKLIIYFTADGRVDFRNLVKELAGIFRTRIELRQIGVRDEAKMLGGLGICGRPFCCTTFLDEFQPVSIRMAKDQSLSLNPTKISGTCGRLMCCLKYEQAAYEHLASVVPPVGSIVQTPDGRGTVTEATLLKEQIRVRLDNAPDQPPGSYPAKKCTVIKKAKGGYDKLEKTEDDA